MVGIHRSDSDTLYCSPPLVSGVPLPVLKSQAYGIRVKSTWHKRNLVAALLNHSHNRGVAEEDARDRAAEAAQVILPAQTQPGRPAGVIEDLFSDFGIGGGDDHGVLAHSGPQHQSPPLSASQHPTPRRRDH